MKADTAATPILKYGWFYDRLRSRAIIEYKIAFGLPLKVRKTDLLSSAHSLPFCKYQIGVAQSSFSHYVSSSTQILARAEALQA